jgi:RHS repeat-associated protein
MSCGRNTLGKISQVTAGGIASPLASNLSYRPFGGPLGLTNGFGGTVNNVAAECDCLTVSNPGQPRERTYGYDADRNLTSITGTNTPWYSQAFGYDQLNRLTSATERYGSISYSYDDVGNRLTRNTNGTVETYTYFPGTNRLQQITGGQNPRTFAYDSNGNITGDGTLNFVYDQNNQLIEVEQGASSLAEYAYNGLGQRVIKQVGANTTVYHYDLDGKLIAESLPDGTMTREYLYMGKVRVSMVDVTGGNALYHYLNDRLGTPEILTDATGTVAWEAWYEPFGEAHIHPGSSVVINIRLPGQYYDSETDLHYNYHRYYDPLTGRYTTSDPVGLEGGTNLYAYVSSNPVNEVDPEGLQWITLFGRTPFYYRIPILRRIFRGPPPGESPRITEPRIRPAHPDARLQPPRGGRINPSDKAFPHDPGADTPGPMGGIVPPVILPNFQQGDPCDNQPPFPSWEEIPEWMKS